MAFKMQERVDGQMAELWKPTNPAIAGVVVPNAIIMGVVTETGEKGFEKTNKDGTKRTEKVPFLIVQEAGTGKMWQTPAHTDMARRIGNVKVGDKVRLTFTAYGDKGSRKYTVEVDQ